MEKKLYRDEYHKMIGGVCAGLAEYFQMDVTIIRILFVITACGGVGFVPYIILWIVIPRKGYDFRTFNSPNVDYTVPPQQPGAQFSTPPPAGGNPFGGNPFGDNPFGSNPAGFVKVKQKSNAGLIIGICMIIFGGIILADNLDFFNYFDVWRFWPVALVAVGCILLISGQRNRPMENQEEPATDIPPATEPAATEEL
jgi:phage shock protein C